MIEGERERKRRKEKEMERDSETETEKFRDSVTKKSLAYFYRDNKGCGALIQLSCPSWKLQCPCVSTVPFQGTGKSRNWKILTVKIHLNISKVTSILANYLLG